MTHALAGIGVAACLAVAVAPAAAQTAGAAAGPAGGASTGILGKMLGNVVGGTGAGNATGLLSYCIKNKLVGGDTATSTLGSLLGRSDVTAAKGFAAGESGNIVTGQSNGISLDQMKGKLKAKVCDMVLQRARSIL